jgi:regulator of protease activity HflC (stomatin/prohibitin superfamily)
MEPLLALAAIVMIGVIMGIKAVPQQQAWIVESLGKFDRKLEPGLNILIPFYQKVAYKHSLKEIAVDVPEQAGITRDNVTLALDGVLYLRIIDPVAASYGVSNPNYAVQLLAQTTMRSEIGKLTLDKTFEERETLNANIVTSINQAAQAWGIQCMRYQAAQAWGIQCMRYEIKNITPPTSVLKAMELQVAADRQKRAAILESEGKQQAQINAAQGAKQQVVLTSEGALTDQVNRAKGEAEAILAVAEATAKGIELVASAIAKQGGNEAVALRVAEQYVSAFRELAKENNTILLPANVGDAGSMVAQALAVFDTIRNKPVAAKGPWA